MKITRIVPWAGLRSALIIGALAAVAGAQNQLWVRHLGSPAGDFAWAAAADGSGGVFMCGFTGGDLGGPNAGSYDAFLARYDRDGGQLWVRQFGTANLDYARAAARDNSGGVFVAGFTDGGPQAGNFDSWITRYDAVGHQGWIQHIETGSNDYAEGAAPDGVGGVYVTGFTGGDLGAPNAGEFDVWLARYDAAGNQVWISQFGSPLDDRAFAAAPDGSGGVYIAGTTPGDLGGGSPGGHTVWIARHDSGGNQTWIRQFGAPGLEFAYGLAVDGSGGVYLCGRAESSLGGPLIGGTDAWVARYDGAGNRAWIRQFGTTSHDEATAAAPDGSGGLLVCGSTGGDLGGPTAGGSDPWLARFDRAGNQTWIRQFGTNAHDSARAAAPDGSGGVFVSGAFGGSSAGGPDASLARFGGLVATRYCAPAINNSTGLPASLDVVGHNAVLANDITLVASQLPQGTFGYFLASQSQDLIVGAGGSQGSLCLGGSIGRFNGSGQVLNSGLSGWFSLQIDLNSLPQPLASVAVQPGDTWNFQAWHRDLNPTATTNFTDAVSVTFN